MIEIFLIFLPFQYFYLRTLHFHLPNPMGTGHGPVACLGITATWLSSFLFLSSFFLVLLHSAVVIRGCPDGLTYFVASECANTRLLFIDLEL